MSGRGGDRWNNSSHMDRRDSGGGGGYNNNSHHHNSNNYPSRDGHNNNPRDGYNNNNNNNNSYRGDRDRGRYNNNNNNNNNYNGPPNRGCGDYRSNGDRGGPPIQPPLYPHPPLPLNPSRRKAPSHVIVFHSYEEEMDFVEERRRKRMTRTSRFDVTPEQLGLSAPITIQPSAAVAAAALSTTTTMMSQLHSSSSSSSNIVDPTAIAAAAAAALFVAHHPSSTTTSLQQQQQQQSLATNAMTLPQQTRHARRLYVGNLPLGVTEQQIHHTFRTAIVQCLRPGCSGLPDPNIEDPILSVYINQERRFSFIEFKSVELCSACMALDGIEVLPGHPTVKVKRPNDYIPSMAPMETIKPILDISLIGLISSAVLDGPNKIFIGGLHYHLQDNQVLELLQAFGKVKSFHLVKTEPDSQLSKGYCFVEYVDPNVTAIAIAGLNGMDIGGGKSLTSRLAGERNGMMMMMQMNATTTTSTDTNTTTTSTGNGGPLEQHTTIVTGYDIEAIVDAAMGQGAMPRGPTYFDTNGIPLTRIVPILPGVTPLPKNIISPVTLPPQIQQSMNPLVFPMNGTPLPQQQQVPQPTMYMNHEMGGPQMMMGYPGQQQQQQQQQMLFPSMMDDQPAAMAQSQQQHQIQQEPEATKILVLLHMVSDDDLATDEDYNGLVEEVRDECAKYGTLLQVQIPRYVGTNSETGSTIEASALRKVYLSYATIEDAQRAQQELTGRQFGPNVVETQYYPETDFAVGLFR
jgi:RNA recognition motif-containing protein